MDKAKLQRALELVKPGLANKDIIEQATSFAFMGDKVVTYNDEISISHPIEGQNIKGAVKAEELYQLLNKTKAKEIDVECTDTEIQITTKNSKAGLSLQTEIVLPLEEIGKIGTFKKLPTNFMEALDFTSFACSNDFSRPILTCVHIRKDGILEASDGFRITQYTIGDCATKSNVLLSSQLVKTLSRFQSIESIAESPGWLHFRTNEGTQISCRIFSGEYPNIEKMGIMQLEDGVEIVFPKSLPEILERASIFTGDAILVSEKEVSIVLKKGNLVVRGESTYGWFEEKAEIDYAGEEITFRTHPEFLRDIAKTMTNCILGEDKIKFIGKNWEHVLALKM